MAYKIDILINYAEIDDNASDEQKGWVSNFKSFLDLMMEQILGKKPTVLLKSDKDTITGADLNDVATLITILSPDYVASESCLNVLNEFSNLATKTDTQRIFKIIKHPVPVGDQPENLKSKISYDLYNIDQETGSIVDFQDFFNEEATNKYWMQLVDIAFDLHDNLVQLVGNTKATSSKKPQKVIYLAETTHDLYSKRNSIKRELQRHGFKIIPDETLPSNIDDFENSVKNYMQKADFSIQLIGAHYGDLPEGSDKSIVDLQNVISGQVASEKTEFQRYIWITPSLKMANEKHKTFIENVKRESDLYSGAEILQTSLEDFKNMIRADIIEGKLAKRKLLRNYDSSESNDPYVYLIHDKIDSGKIAPLKSELENSGFSVLTPKFEGELMDIRENHIGNLIKFDGAIIFQGDVNRQWVRMKILDLLKAPGFGRAKPMKGRALISNEFSGFENYEKQGISMLSNDNTLDSNLQSFINDLKVN